MSNVATPHTSSRWAPLTPDVPPASPPPESSGPRARAPFRPDIEGLRAVAVLLVVAYHVGIRGITGGFVGVDVFFVLSGYLITEILTAQLERTGRLDFAQFYARRARRLLPAASLMLLATMAAALVLFTAMDRIEFSLSAAATSLYASNVFFMSRATDYFALGADGNPLLHTWSLAVEEQFYLVWPVLVLVGYRLGRSSRRGLGWVLAVVSFVSFAGCVWLTRKNAPWAFFGTPARAWEFGIGGLASLAGATAFGRRWRGALGLVGLGAIAASTVAIGGGTSFPGFAAALPTLGTIAVLLAGATGAASEMGLVERVLATRPMQWIGARSYSWYLWHWPALVFGAALIPNLGVSGRIGAAALGLAIAAVTHALIENPVRFHPRLVARPVLSIAIGGMLTISGAAIALVVHRDALAHGGRYWAAVKELPAAVSRGCMTDFGEAEPRVCTFGDTASQTVVALLGDSHAMQWFPPLDAIAHRRHWRLVTMMKYSCPMARVSIYNRVLHRMYAECDRFRASALERAVALHPAAVLVANEDQPLPMTLGPDGRRATVTASSWRDGVHATLATLDSAGVPAVLFRDTPLLAVAVPQCLAQADRRSSPHDACGASRATAVSATTDALAHDAAAGFAHVGFVDMTDEICGPATCPPERGGIVSYKDGNHLSVRFALSLRDALDARLGAIVSPIVGARRP